jgi:hypothetical protein
MQIVDCKVHIKQEGIIMQIVVCNAHIKQSHSDEMPGNVAIKVEENGRETLLLS